MKRTLATLLCAVLLLGAVGLAQAACTTAINTEWKGNAFAGLYLKADTYKIALYQTAATWDATTKQYSATNEVTGTNYTAGGYALDSYTLGTSGTTYWLDFADEVQATVTLNQATTCAIIYDDTAANTSCSATGTPWPCCTGSNAGTCADSVLAVVTFTIAQPSAGTLTITFPTADSSTAFMRIARGLWEKLSPLGVAFAEEQYEIPAGRRDAHIEIKGLTMDAAANF